MLLDQLQPFAISLMVGLAAGIERERHNLEGEGAMGVRTFSLIALLGTVAAASGSATLTLGLAILVAALVSLGYWRGTTPKVKADEDGRSSDIGLTTEIAAGLVFAVGYLAIANPLLAGVLGIVLVTVLFSRQRLHAFSRELLRPAEIRAVLILAVFVFVVVPFIPDRTIDPWGLINPKRLAQIIGLIAALDFGGYVAERVAGQRAGLLATGFFGGFASSTAVFFTLAKAAKSRPEERPELLGAGLMATSATVMLFAAIALATAPALAKTVGITAIVCAAVSALLGFRISKASKHVADKSDELRKPLDLWGTAKLGLFIFALLAISAITKRTLGSEALMVVSFTGGLFELHGITYANAALFVAKTLTANEATLALLLALVASFVSKIGICWAMAFGKFAAAMTGYLLIIIGSGFFTFMLIDAVKL